MSYQTERPAIDEIAPRIPITARLAALALTFAVLIGVPLGVLSAVRQDTWLDYTLRVLSLSGLALPAFWLGLLILMAFVAWFGTIPIYSSEPSGFWNTLLMYSVPAAAVGFRSSAFLTRLTRSSMLEVLRQDYIRTARSKGASEMTINYYHALKNAMLPVVTVIGIEFAFLIGGLVVTEQVFNLNGIGRLMVLSVQNQDYTLTQALVILTVTIGVLSNLVVDLFYAWLDPRIRLA
jgi:peptide/nickel transport system permease protein